MSLHDVHYFGRWICRIIALCHGFQASALAVPEIKFVFHSNILNDESASKIGRVSHNFWLTNFWSLFAADSHATNKHQLQKIIKIMQHCSYLGYPLIEIKKNFSYDCSTLSKLDLVWNSYMIYFTAKTFSCVINMINIKKTTCQNFSLA